MVKKETIELNKTEYTGLLNRVKFFQTIVHEISSRKPLQELFDQIIESSKRLLDSEAASLLLLNNENGMMQFHTIAGGRSSSIKSRDLKIGEGLGGWVALNKKPLIVNDCYSDKRFSPEFDIATGYRTRNMVCVPMINRNSLIGVIQVINKNGKRILPLKTLNYSRPFQLNALWLLKIRIR